MEKKLTPVTLTFRGFSLVRWLVVLSFVAIALVIITVGFYEGRKAYWNNKVNELCAEDGGGEFLKK